jgi:D-amino-acid dehydrogenase
VKRSLPLRSSVRASSAAALRSHCRSRGAAVTLIDRDEPGRGCSYGNSGAISPGSVAPLAMPGILSSVPGMLLDEESPLHLPLRYLPTALPWLLRFVASAQPSRVALSAAKLAALHAGAVDRHAQLARELGVPELFVRRGHLHLYPDARALAKDAGGWRMRRYYGYQFQQLDRAGILALEPHVGERYRLGVFVADHATIVNPFRYVQAMVRGFARRGGQQRRDEVQAMTPLADGRWQLRTAAEADAAANTFDRVVVAAGAWARRLLDPLGVHLALESQRGYHVQFDGGRDTVSRTVVLADRKIFVTPMEDGLRVGGTVEFGGLTSPPEPRRAAILERIARETFGGLEALSSTQWMGHRPCIARFGAGHRPRRRPAGLWLAVGHGHLGLTDSINTAQRIADGIARRAEGKLNFPHG